MYKFERLSSQNIEQLIYLYKHAFNYNTSIDFLKKKYNTAIFGAQYIGYIAIEKQNNEPAAYYGVFPIICVKNNVKVLAAQSGDTMTHPKHQGKGLFTNLAKLTFDLAKAEGVDFIFGFPNNNSYPGFIRKLNWLHYSDINNYFIKINSLPFDKLAKKVPLFSSFYNYRINNILKPYLVNECVENSLFKQMNNLGCILHDQKFFDYKGYSSLKVIKLINIKCVIKIDGKFWVGDIDYCEENKFNVLLNELMKLAKKLNCSSMQFSTYEGSTYDNYLKKKYSVKSKNPVCSLSLKNQFDPSQFAYQALDFDTY